MTLTSWMTFLCTFAVAHASTPPSTGNDWISLQKGIEFQPASSSDAEKNAAIRAAQTRFLEEEGQQGGREASHNQQVMFLDTQETYYDGYAQAWRYVGFYTDCNPQDDDRRRKLNEDEEEPCKRYLLWALYADMNYQGKGIGEYQFYDTYAQQWDKSACETIGTSDANCRKMDCHLPNTHFQLLGYFKEEEWSEWFEQLFKHEGYCVWQKGEYDFMYENYNSWPEECTETEYYLSSGEPLYYDLKPLPNATMSIGLFTDSRCSQDYTGEEYTVESILSGGDGDDFMNAYNIEYFDKAMDIYRVCQPCRAYALHNNNGGGQRRLDDNGNNPNNGLFQCDDAAGYTDVNQCMKFRTKTDMEYATFNEVYTAAQQGGVTSVTIGKRTYGSYLAGSRVLEEEANPPLVLFWASVGVLLFGVLLLSSVSIWSYRRNGTCAFSKDEMYLEEPLVPTSLIA